MVIIIPDRVSLLARFLAPTAGYFQSLFCLARSIRLCFLFNIYLIDIKWLAIEKKFFDVRIWS